MKNTHICTKCNGSNIIRIEGSVRGISGAGNNISLAGNSILAVNVHRYLCCECGFSEEWIDKEDIAKIKNCKNPRG